MVYVSIWYKGLNKVLKLQTTQNKLIRSVLDLESRAHISEEHFELLKWLPINSRVVHLTSCFFFKMKNSLSPKMVFIPITLYSAAKGHLLFQR